MKNENEKAGERKVHLVKSINRARVTYFEHAKIN